MSCLLPLRKTHLDGDFSPLVSRADMLNRFYLGALS